MQACGPFVNRVSPGAIASQGAQDGAHIAVRARIP
jgi:hypothetical protein